MPSVVSLRDTIHQQQFDLESKRKLADDLMRSSAEHEARGDEVKAKLDRESAERYLRDAEGIEKTIVGYQTDIQHREQKAADIDRRIADLKARFEHETRHLEDEKKSVLSAIVFRDDVREAARRAVKDKQLNDKERQLQRDFQRELGNLEREKQLLLG